MKGLRRIIKDRKPFSALLKGGRWVGLALSMVTALFFWFLLILDNPGGYVKEYRIPLVLPDLPGRYVVTDSSFYPQSLTVGVRAEGGRLFRHSINTLFFKPKPFKPIPDTVHLDRDGGILELSARSLKSQLLHSQSLPASTRRLLSDTINDISISVPRLTLGYQPLLEAEAEVIFAGQVDFGSLANLKLVDTVGIIPRKVLLYGPSGKIDSLKKAPSGIVVRTDTTTIKIGNPGKVMLPVSLITPKGMHASPDTVYLSFVTEELVHTTYMVKDIEVRGLDRGYTLRLLPNAVRVTTLVPRRQSTNSGYEPKLYVDASHAIGAPAGYQLEVRVANLTKESGIEMLQLDPDRLNFILEEKINIQKK